MTDKKDKKEYDIGNETEEKQAELSAKLTDLQHNEGWKLIMRVFETNIIHLENQIITKISAETNERLTEAEVDRLRDKHGYLNDLMKTPENLKKQIEYNPEMVVEDLDPYYKTKKDVDIDNSKGTDSS